MQEDDEPQSTPAQSPDDAPAKPVPELTNLTLAAVLDLTSGVSDGGLSFLNKTPFEHLVDAFQEALGSSATEHELKVLHVLRRKSWDDECDLQFVTLEHVSRICFGEPSHPQAIGVLNRLKDHEFIYSKDSQHYVLPNLHPVLEIPGSVAEQDIASFDWKRVQAALRNRWGKARRVTNKAYLLTKKARETEGMRIPPDSNLLLRRLQNTTGTRDRLFADLYCKFAHNHGQVSSWEYQWMERGLPDDWVVLCNGTWLGIGVHAAARGRPKPVNVMFLKRFAHWCRGQGGLLF